MIEVDGVTWGRAAELARQLGPDVTAAMVRRWADRLRLARREADGRVWFRLDEVADAERRTRQGGRGRPRGGAS